MRIFGRILYATIMVGFFLLAFTYSRDLMTTTYIEDVFGESLTDTDSELPKYYYFYSSIPDYHNSEPVIEINSGGYEIMGYEVAQVSINNEEELLVEEYIYFIIYSETQDLSQIDYMYLKDSNTEEEFKIYVDRFKTLYLLNAVNDSGTIYISKEDVLSEEFDTLCLVSLEDDVEENILETSYTIDSEDFSIKDYLTNFYDENLKLPESSDLNDMASFNVYPYQTHVATDYAYIFWIGMGIYFAVLIISTYLIYFRRRKKYN